MRRAERTCRRGAGGDLLGAQQSGHGVNGEHFECFLFIEWRQNAGQSTGKHGLAGTRRADEPERAGASSLGAAREAVRLAVVARVAQQDPQRCDGLVHGRHQLFRNMEAGTQPVVKAHPGELSYSSSGTGGSPHLAAEWFKSRAGIELVHVAYKGTSPQIVDLLSGTVKVAFPTMPGMIEHVKQGKLRALAVTSPKRSPLLPEVPTMIEAGFEGYVATSWSGAMVPTGTPAPIVQQLSAAITQVLAMPEVQQKLAVSGADAVGSTPEAFKAFIEDETLKWGKVIKDANIVNQ